MTPVERLIIHISKPSPRQKRVERIAEQLRNDNQGASV